MLDSGRRWAEIDVHAARDRIRGFIHETPIIEAPELTAALGVPVHLKLENLQRTGSFKVRGAASRMAILSSAERSAGVVTCSSGNHGRAVAHMAQQMGLAATICVPQWVDPVKLASIERSGAQVDRTGASYDEAESRAQELAQDRGLVMIHPFDDPLVVAGQGTIALEILESMPDVGSVVVPLSGGGLCGGIALAVQRVDPNIAVVAVSAERADTMLASLAAGRPIEVPEEATVANALSGGIGLANRWTFELIRDVIQVHVRVTEEDLRSAMRDAAGTLHLVVEGGGAVGLAAAHAGDLDGLRGPIVIVVSGGNVDLGVLANVATDSTAGS